MNGLTLNIPGLKRPGLFLLLLPLFLFIVFLILDIIFPVDLKPETQSMVILSKENKPLRAFPDEKGNWRYPVTLDDVSPNYTEALIGYEDKYFYHHPGINPISLLRAAFQYLTSGKIISGGSTLTMQTARLRRSMPRTVTGKFYQIFTAIQLEFHFSKDEILTYYINHAPFGGTFEGILSGCYAYFDHNAKELTHAEAALMAVMPQAPSRYRPDRFPDAAEKARNKLLDRLLKFNIWSKNTIVEAKEEKVTPWPVETKLYAPILSRRLYAKNHTGMSRIKTCIDYQLQLSMEQLAKDYASILPPHVSTAILAMNNKTGGVESYVGSSDFFNDERFGHVDMVTALRSPGSTMKPFIYGMALDEGFIHSQSLLMDVPIHFGGYHPVNFQRSFSGPVSAAYALSHSLNLPAVQLLDHITPKLFYAEMVNSGFKIKLPTGAVPNLSMALGGFSTNLENLVKVYSCLGKNGKAIKPRYLYGEKIVEQKLLSAGSAWIIHDILLNKKNNQLRQVSPGLAIKTGTSYGFRDSWAIGTDKTYTIGVWVGRPDGTPVPGQYGSQTATPLLKMAFQLLPQHDSIIERPSSVCEQKICWPGGQFADNSSSSSNLRCSEQRNAWILNRTAPKTLTPTSKDSGPAVSELKLKLTKDFKYRIPEGCASKSTYIIKKLALWPRQLESWIPYQLRRESIIPPVLPECKDSKDIILNEHIKIEGLNDGDEILKKEKSNKYPAFKLKITGGTGPWYWFENSKLKKQGKTFKFIPSHPGKYQILSVDQSGSMDKIEVKVY